MFPAKWSVLFCPSQMIHSKEWIFWVNKLNWITYEVIRLFLTSDELSVMSECAGICCDSSLTPFPNWTHIATKQVSEYHIVSLLPNENVQRLDNVLFEELQTVKLCAPLFRATANSFLGLLGAWWALCMLFSLVVYLDTFLRSICQSQLTRCTLGRGVRLLRSFHCRGTVHDQWFVHWKYYTVSVSHEWSTVAESLKYHPLMS